MSLPFCNTGMCRCMGSIGDVVELFAGKKAVSLL